MQQLSLDLGTEEHAPAAAQDLAGAYWLAFTADTDPTEARARFWAKYGTAPRELRPGLGGLLLAGPILRAEVTA